MTENASRPRYLLGQVACVLARIDLPAALVILDDVERTTRTSQARNTTNSLDQLIGAFALKLAAQSPADAERVLNRLSLRIQTALVHRRGLLETAPRIARAPRIADSRVSPDAPAYRPYILGLMAQAIAGADKAGAARLISNAYEGLEELTAAGSPVARNDPSMWPPVCYPSSSRWNQSEWPSSWVAPSH